MKRQTKRPAKEEAESTALSALKPGADGGSEATESRGIMEFLPSALRHDWLLGFFLVAVTFIAYQPVWHAGFVWDDNSMLLHNPLIPQAGGWYRIWFNRAAGDFVPATTTSLWLEWRLWGANPLGYHLDNVLLHVCNALLLWRIVLRLKIPGAWLAAALFAVHPVNVESVAWIAQRKNTLAMLFCLAAVQCYLTFEDSRRRRWFWLAAGMFLLALMGKAAVVPLPVVLLGLAWWRRGRIDRKDVQHSLIFMALAAAGSLLAMWIQQGAANGLIVRPDSFWSRLAGAGWAVWFYLYKAVLPLNLIFVYPRWQIDARNVLSYIPLALLAAAFVLCWRCRRRWGKALFFGLAYFVVMLLPVLGFLNIYFMRYSLVADHWQYFAIIGPIVLAAAIIRRPMLAAALLLALGALTWKQCRMYADAETLWQTTIRQNPNCWMAHLNLGAALDEKGKVDEAIVQYKETLKINPDDAKAHNNLGLAFFRQGRLDEAISQYQKALESKPDFAEAHYNLGLSFGKQGRLAQAILQYQKALEIKPDYAEAHNNFGVALRQKGKVDEAILQYQKALETDPDYAEAHYNLGNALLQNGREDEAIAHYQQAAQIKPGFAEAHYNLGNALRQKGRLEEAIAHYQQALQIEPADPKIQNDLAWLLATCAEASLRNGAKAVELARQANALTGGGNPAILHTLAAALAEAGRFPEALETAQRASHLAGAQSNTVVAAEVQSEMKSYQAGRPFHGPEQTH
jgi:tetratricopeptide (TPR) repeat protein